MSQKRAYSNDLAFSTRRPPLSAEREIELSKCMEDAQAAILRVVSGSPHALDALAAVAEQLAEGTLDVSHFGPAAAIPERDYERVATEILEVVHSLRARQPRGRGRSRAGSLAGSPEKDALRSELVRLGLAYGLGQWAADRVVSELSAMRRARRGPAGELDSVINAIVRHRHQFEEARTELIEANMGLVIWAATKRTDRGLSMRDLIQEGSMGLMRAVDKFDYRRGVRFNTYAVWWIRHFINRSLSDRSRTIRVPVYLFEARAKVLRNARQFTQEMGREPTEAELFERTGVSLEQIRNARSLPSEPLSMELPVGDEGDRRLGDSIADTDATSPVDRIAEEHAHHHLRELLEGLTPREQEVLKFRFGLDGAEVITLAEIGKRFSLSRERIRQIEAEALVKLRHKGGADLASHLEG